MHWDAEAEAARIAAVDAAVDAAVEAGTRLCNAHVASCCCTECKPVWQRAFDRGEVETAPPAQLTDLQCAMVRHTYDARPMVPRLGRLRVERLSTDGYHVHYHVCEEITRMNASDRWLLDVCLGLEPWIESEHRSAVRDHRALTLFLSSSGIDNSTSTDPVSHVWWADEVWAERSIASEHKMTQGAVDREMQRHIAILACVSRQFNELIRSRMKLRHRGDRAVASMQKELKPLLDEIVAGVSAQEVPGDILSGVQGAIPSFRAMVQDHLNDSDELQGPLEFEEMNFNIQHPASWALEQVLRGRIAFYLQLVQDTNGTVDLTVPTTETCVADGLSTDGLSRRWWRVNGWRVNGWRDRFELAWPPRLMLGNPSITNWRGQTCNDCSYAYLYDARMSAGFPHDWRKVCQDTAYAPQSFKDLSAKLQRSLFTLVPKWTTELMTHALELCKYRRKRIITLDDVCYLLSLKTAVNGWDVHYPVLQQLLHNNWFLDRRDCHACDSLRTSADPDALITKAEEEEEEEEARSTSSSDDDEEEEDDSEDEEGRHRQEMSLLFGPDSDSDEEA